MTHNFKAFFFVFFCLLVLRQVMLHPISFSSYPWHNCSITTKTSVEICNTQFGQCAHTVLSTPSTQDPDLLTAEQQCLSRCYAAQWPWLSLCCLSVVFSISMDDVIFECGWRLERIHWITLGLPGCQKPQSASLPRCNSALLLDAASRRRIYLTPVWSDVTEDTAI